MASRQPARMAGRTNGTATSLEAVVEKADGTGSAARWSRRSLSTPPPGRPSSTRIGHGRCATGRSSPPASTAPARTGSPSGVAVVALVTGTLVLLVAAWWLWRSGGVRLHWRTLLIGVPGFFFVYYLLLATVGQRFSPSMLPARGHIALELLKYGIAGTGAQIVLGWLALRHRLSLAERLPTPTASRWWASWSRCCRWRSCGRCSRRRTSSCRAAPAGADPRGRGLGGLLRHRRRRDPAGRGGGVLRARRRSAGPHVAPRAGAGPGPRAGRDGRAGRAAAAPAAKPKGPKESKESKRPKEPTEPKEPKEPKESKGRVARAEPPRLEGP